MDIFTPSPLTWPSLWIWGNPQLGLSLSKCHAWEISLFKSLLLVHVCFEGKVGNPFLILWPRVLDPSWPHSTKYSIKNPDKLAVFKVNTSSPSNNLPNTPSRSPTHWHLNKLLNIYLSTISLFQKKMKE